MIAAKRTFAPFGRLMAMSDERISSISSGRRATRRCAIVTAFLTAFAGGCTTPRPPPIAATDTILRPSPKSESDLVLVEAKFIDIKGDPVSVDNRPANLSLTLGIIPGAIAGKPSRTLQVVRIAKLSEIQINLGTFEAAIIKQAAPMTAAFADSGLRIDPVDTRFARASTLLNYSGVLPGDLFVEFADQESKNPLTLVYFDRPCRLTGAKTIANTGSEMLTLVYDVTVEKPGLNWLVRSPKGSNGFVVRTATEPTRKMLVVVPVENLKHASVQMN